MTCLLDNQDCPRSPRAALDTYRPNCSSRDLSSPSPLRMAACSSELAVGPASSATGSPPPIRTSMKVTNTTANTSGKDTARRRNRKRNS